MNHRTAAHNGDEHTLNRRTPNELTTMSARNLRRSRRLRWAGSVSMLLGVVCVGVQLHRRRTFLGHGRKFPGVLTVVDARDPRNDDHENGAETSGNGRLGAHVADRGIVGRRPSDGVRVTASLDSLAPQFGR